MRSKYKSIDSDRAGLKETRKASLNDAVCVANVYTRIVKRARQFKMVLYVNRCLLDSIIFEFVDPNCIIKVSCATRCDVTPLKQILRRLTV